ncbi:hypothetical protein LTR91_003872 [Friedmanniomyces endolithicus]|uniref:Autophagy-related protein 6 n=1 Tax=Friedmanniomyces endolithicus TaxID=329885 RepID=A0AAN6QZI1_9PEZI|nr:hypothetical protein LTR57_003482 [Friedmanniomyces endolithicus]KAK1005946.1 hypothetical protein LTR91_003872 [Friedmanniomyces endolithicus]
MPFMSAVCLLMLAVYRVQEVQRVHPYSKLDPGLRDFLEKESPLKYEVAQPSPARPSPDAASNEYRSQLGWTEPPPSTTQRSANEPSTPASVVPPESLYQDGRYAYLWKNYRPRAEVEAASQTEADKLRAVIDAYNDRRTAIGRAAVENCVLEQMAERECWESGNFKDMMNMCRGPGRQFMRCYTMQSRFLKALGYLSLERSEAEEERIQMHADRLYHEMLAREAAAEEARKSGMEAPVLPPLITKESTTAALGTNSAWAEAHRRTESLGPSTGLNLSDYTPDRQEQIKKQLASLATREERELEMQLIAAERRSQVEIAERIQERFLEEQKSRESRRERGKETVGDTIKRMWGWDQHGGK